MTPPVSSSSSAATIVSDGRSGISFFRAACQDLQRITSNLFLETEDIIRPRSKQTAGENLSDQTTFFLRAWYMALVAGFSPIYFNILPFSLYRIYAGISNLIWRPFVVSPILRLMGYSELCGWRGPLESPPGKAFLAVTGDGEADEEDDMVEQQPMQPYDLTDFAKVGRLAKVGIEIDPWLNKCCADLVKRGALTAPHSQAPRNPFSVFLASSSASPFPGNFFDHLIGVWKVRNPDITECHAIYTCSLFFALFHGASLVSLSLSLSPLNITHHRTILSSL